MKRRILIVGIIVFAVALLAPQITQAQGTMTYLSNMGQTSAGNLAVGSDSWYAALFFTGNNASGYSLNSVSLGMADASGNPSNFTVMLYSATSGFGTLPGTNLETLDGSLNPATGGNYTFTTISNLMLSPGTPYFIVLTAGTAVANGAFGWNYVNTYAYSQNGGWRTFADIFDSSDGSSWNIAASSDSQFAINATAIPEPGILSLLSLGGLGFLWHRRKNSPRKNRG